MGDNAAVLPLDLRRTAAAIAASHDGLGAIVIVITPQGLRLGVEGLTPDEIRDACCSAIHSSYLAEEGTL